MPIIDVRGIPVEFPYEPYAPQLAYMEKVIEALSNESNALLESPTGTGKTLCLLCSCLAWRRHYMATRVMKDYEDARSDRTALTEQSGLKIPRIIYATRTHSQLSQVVQELKRCAYKPRMCVLGSRAQFCIHQDISKLNGTVQSIACRSAVSNRSCQYSLSVSDYSQDPAISTGVNDLEDLIKFGKEKRVCPFLISRELLETAEIVFIPYNYLVDSNTRDSLHLDLKDAIIVLDEAHNIEGVCSDVASFDLTAADVAHCIEEVGFCLKSLVETTFVQADCDPSELATLKSLFLNLEKKIDSVPLNSEKRYSADGAAIFSFLQDVGVNEENHKQVLVSLEKCSKLFAELRELFGTRQGSHLDKIADVLKIVFRGGRNFSKFYKVHVHEEQATSKAGPKTPFSVKQARSGGRTLSYWCFRPGITMSQFSHLPRSILLTSGTLSPMESFAYELDVPFPVRLENPHIIQKEQIWVGVIRSGPGNVPLSSAYTNRDNEGYKRDLGNAIFHYCRTVPDGLLVFFPSYGTLNSLIEFWKTVRPTIVFLIHLPESH
eukprot:TRINITY_DN10114_c0_g1_i1.p1 TRINITY_DN10114_c0_g1~~TRINITY_DN10114_c0_g1_i1.p1  ORF type:complete len:548 (+),score=68.82 TRINITY_DN10114_c0_g1_i1:68-1711(+)